MTEILTGAVLLICTVLLIRKLTYGKISMWFRYALWLLVVLRLIVPVSFGSSRLSVLNLLPGWLVAQEDADELAEEAFFGFHMETDTDKTGESTDKKETDGRNSTSDVRTEDGMPVRVSVRSRMDQSGEAFAAKTDELPDAGTEMQEVQSADYAGLHFSRRLRLLLTGIWVAGIAATGGYMLISQAVLIGHLHSRREEIAWDRLPACWQKRLLARRIRVYRVSGLPGPCLVGHGIYIPSHVLYDQQNLHHILAHEYVHSVHGDTIWALVRSALCAVYWFCPLVWVAAYEAKKDSELACDEHAVRILGEKERYAYGRTLLALLVCREERIHPAGAVSIMSGRENSVKERIAMIAGKGKRSKAAAAWAVLCAVCICGCAFTGAERQGDSGGAGKTILLTNEGSLSGRSSDAETDMAEEGMPYGEQDEKASEDEKFESEEWEEGAVQQRIAGQRQEETARDMEDVKVSGAEAEKFEEALYQMDDSGLEAAETVDITAYYDYLYEGAAFPLEDGRWYQLQQDKEKRIAFYGLYTQAYGFRGLKIKIGDDVNCFDQLWLPTSFPIDVTVLEESEPDGMPRSFAFKTCIINNGDSEIWQLYVADRYDTGTIELHCFESEACREQLKTQNITLNIVQDEQIVELVENQDTVIDKIDISRYADEDVEMAVWDSDSMGFILQGAESDRIEFVTGVALKETGSGRTFCNGLPLIIYPVEIGEFGEREFTLGQPYVDTRYVSGKL